MIQIKGEEIQIAGDLPTVLTETAMMCGRVYRMLHEEMGKDAADRFFFTELPLVIMPPHSDDGGTDEISIEGVHG